MAALRMPIPRSTSNGLIGNVDDNDDILSIRSFTSSNGSRDEKMSALPCQPPPCTVTPPVRLEGITEGRRCESATQYRHPNGLHGYATTVETPDGGEGEVLHPNEDWLDQFAVVIMKKRCPTAKGGSEIEKIRIRSPLIKVALSEALKDYPGFSTAESLFGVMLNAPFESLVHNWDIISNLAEKHCDSETREHLQILQDAIWPVVEKPLKKLEECMLHGNITYSSLWTIFKPGQLIYRKDYLGREVIEKIQSTYYECIKGEEVFRVVSDAVCWDGARFGTGTSTGNFGDEGGAMSLSDLPAMPLEMHPDREAIKARVLRRAQKFASLTKCEVKAYTGPVGEPTHERRRKEEALQVGDRLMINPTAVGCPLMAKNLDPLVKENVFDCYQNGGRVSSPGSLKRERERRYVTDLRKARFEWSKSAETKKPLSGRAHQVLTEDQLLITVPDVAAFDLKRKDWTVVDVDEISDVAWNEDAYDDIVFPAEEKDLLLAVAGAYVPSTTSPITVPEKRAKGTTICLAGPSGMGKVSIVEAIAERLHAPLFAVDMAEMIRDWDNFEDNMVKVLHRCREWGAILLVTNIDLLMEKALNKYGKADTASTFRHHLSTHPGLIFVTATAFTDRFEPLLASQFDLLIQVPALDVSSRRQVWEDAINNALPLKQRKFKGEDLDMLAEKELSAREIKSALKMALMLARSRGSTLKVEHVERVIAIKEKSKLQMEGEKGEEDKKDDEEEEDDDDDD